MQKQTTGATISRLGVLTVLLNNGAPVQELADGDKIRFEAEVKAILDGKRGPSADKVKARSAQRCHNGGALYSINGVGIYGTN